MPLTTESEAHAESGGPIQPGDPPPVAESQPRVGSESGYDVLASAAAPTQRRQPKRWDEFVLYNIAIPILLIVVGVAVLWLRGTKEAATAPPPSTDRAAVLQTLTEVKVERVQSLQNSKKQLELYVDGTVVPFREARISSEVAGRIKSKELVCEAGSIVQQGDLLMTIDEDDYRLEYERLTELVAQEYQAVREVDQELDNVARSTELALREIALRKQEVDRLKALKQFASKSEVERAESAMVQADQQLQTLENQKNLLKARRTRFLTSEKLASKQLESAKLNWDRCEIHAPISGVIVSEEVDVNTFVNRGTMLLTIEDTSKVEVAANMRMDQLHWVLDQAPPDERGGYGLPLTPAIVEYEVAGRKGTVHRWNGELVSYDGIGIDPSTRTVPVRLIVDDPTKYFDEDDQKRSTDGSSALVRGMFVRVRLLLDPQTDLVLVPGKALRPGSRVWKFSADDSVLDNAVLAAEKEAEKLAASQAAPSPPTAKPQDEQTKPSERTERFLAADWSAGQVKVTAPLYPIDSLRVATQPTDDNDVSASIQSEARLWVCEAGKNDLKDGDDVVVSTLQSVPPEGLPARANISP